MVTLEQREQAFLWVLESLERDEVAVPIIAAQFGPDDWAFVLEGIPNDLRLPLWDTIQEDKKGPILAAMREDSRNQLLGLLSSENIAEVAKTSTAEHLVEILDVLPRKLAKGLLNTLTPQQQTDVNTALNYSEEQVGRYANHDVYPVPKSTLVGELRAQLQQTPLPAYTDSFLVVDDAEHFLGQVTLNQLMAAPADTSMVELAQQSDQVLVADTSLIDASEAVESSGLSMLPVIASDGRLLGRFTVKDALEVYQEHYEAQMSHMGQVSDEDLFAPVAISARRRAVWLGINLATAFLASMVIGVFDQVVAQVVALAVLMPIVASMGGITGSQTLTLTIRGLATGQLAASNIKALNSKEFKVAMLNGVLWALVVAFIASLWFGNAALSAIIAVALVVNMLVAALCGIAIPVLLDRLGIDPALAGSVILTTVTDVVGFFVFLGSAALFLV